MCLKKVNFIKNNLSMDELKKWIPGWYKKIINLNTGGKYEGEKNVKEKNNKEEADPTATDNGI